jgi:hypothetical protein
MSAIVDPAIIMSVKRRDFSTQYLIGLAIFSEIKLPKRFHISQKDLQYKNLKTPIILNLYGEENDRFNTINFILGDI